MLVRISITGGSVADAEISFEEGEISDGVDTIPQPVTSNTVSSRLKMRSVFVLILSNSTKLPPSKESGLVTGYPCLYLRSKFYFTFRNFPTEGMPSLFKAKSKQYPRGIWAKVNGA